MSPEVQNKGISGSTKRTYVLHFFRKRPETKILRFADSNYMLCRIDYTLSSVYISLSETKTKIHSFL